MKILDISGENGISTLDTFSIKRTTNSLYKMTTSKVEDSSTGPATYIDSSGSFVTVPAEMPLVIDRKYVNIGAFENFLTNPTSPANQITDTLGIGSYTLWIRGSGSVAITANTATITGSGSAYQGSPLHFSVTGAGSVNVTVTGSCSVFQLTGTPFSTEPVLNPSRGITAARSGTISAPMETGDKLYSLLDGNPDSVELVHKVTPIVMAYLDSNNYGTYDVETGIGRIVSNGLFSYIRWVVLASTYSYYELKYELINAVSGGIQIGTGTTSVAIALLNSQTRRFINNGSSPTWFVLNRFAPPCDVTFKVSVKKITRSSFKLLFKWTPKFNHSDLPVSTTGNILHSGTQAILQFRRDGSGNGYIDLTDGTNTTSVALDWVYGTEYSIQAIVDASTSEMQLIVDSTRSVKSSFDGSFGPDTEVTFGYNTDYHQEITKPVFDRLKQGEIQ